jgi:salicylate hydroxylase
LSHARDKAISFTLRVVAVDQNKLSVAVIGAGIGGLTAALCLRRFGIDATVYEQSRAAREVGAGINVTPNATRILHALGLAGLLSEHGVVPSHAHQRRWEDGRTLSRTPLGAEIERRFGFRQYQFHRADLLNILMAAVPADRLHFSHRLASFSDSGQKVEILFENGVRTRADALIGADGIHSTVQRLLFGEARPNFTGCAAYRALVPADKVAHAALDPALQATLGPRSHFVSYFVSRGRLVNLVGIVEQPHWTNESWTERGGLSGLRSAFSGWHNQVQALLGAVAETFIFGLFDRVPLLRWSAGRVSLLGDACHPMLPFMAQGAAQAIEDAMTLAVCLREIPDVPRALARYQDLRLPRTSFVQSLSAANKIRFHLPDGPEQEKRDMEMAGDGSNRSLQARSWLYGYDAASALQIADLGIP